MGCRQQWSEDETDVLLEGCAKLNVTGCIRLDQIGALFTDILTRLPRRDAMGVIRMGRKLGCIELSAFHYQKAMSADEKFKRVMLATNNGHALA